MIVASGLLSRVTSIQRTTVAAHEMANEPGFATPTPWATFSPDDLFTLVNGKAGWREPRGNEREDQHRHRTTGHHDRSQRRGDKT